MGTVYTCLDWKLSWFGFNQSFKRHPGFYCKSATTSLEPTSSGGSCSCSSQRCLIVILQTRVQVVYLCSYLLMSKTPALSFWPPSASLAGSRDCPVGSVHAGPVAPPKGVFRWKHTRNMGQNPEKLGCEHRTKNLHWFLILQQSVFHWNASIESWMISFWKTQNASFSKLFSQTIIRVCTESGNPKVVCFRAQVFWMLLLFTLLGWSKFIISNF